jgi:hypothetical protein
VGVTDRTVLFDDLLNTPNLRAKSYVVHEATDRGLACIELCARRLEDWFFARRWVVTRSGRRLLFWLLDEVEAHGFRFRVKQGGAPSDREEEPWLPAAQQWSALSPEERSIHAELFPEEEKRLREGYDWDHAHVYRFGAPLRPDESGRILEEVDGFVTEWVRVPEEFTWRRFPLYASMRKPMTSGAPTDAIRGT